MDSTKDEVVAFNRTGSSFGLDKNAFKVSAPEYNMGSSKKGKEGAGTGGLPSQENPLADMYPKSNILLNVSTLQPSYLPYLNEIFFGFGIVYKLIRVGQVAAKAIKEG